MMEVRARTLLRPPHDMSELTILSEPPLRRFFETCVEATDFVSAASEREQVQLVYKWAQQYAPDISLRQIADFFQLAKSTIWHHLRKPVETGVPESPCTNGRPSLLTSEQMSELSCFIQSRFEQKIPATYEDCREFLLERFDLAVESGSLRAFITRSCAFKTVIGHPIEDLRAFSSEEAIDEYLTQLEQTLNVAQIPAAFIVNIDEAGFAEFADRHTTTRIVPASYPLNSVGVPVSRAEKRATLLAGICADGSALKPLVIVQRDTLERELLVRGYTADKIMFETTEKGYMNTEVFIKWGKKCFIPEMQRRRQDFGYDGPIILLLDQFGCHVNEVFIAMCEEANVVCTFLPPHTSDQLQPCDLGLFGIQKKWMSSIQIPDGLNRQTRQIVRIIDSYRMATTFKNVTSAFRRAGIVTYLDDELRLMARVDIRYASAVRHLQCEHCDVLPNDNQRINIR